MKVSHLISSLKGELERAGLECADPMLHAKQILQYVSGWTASELYIRWDEEVPPAIERKASEFLARRSKGEPFQYIAGEEGFWKSRFVVGPGVLIPRRETELLVEKLLQVPGERLKVAELGAGSGNIGISVCLERPTWEWHAFEISPEALQYARTNARDLGVSPSYHLHEGDFFDGARALAPFDVVVSNPPYVPSADWPTLSKEVRHEPKLALDGGHEGTSVLSRLSMEAVSLLKPGGYFAAEIDSRQEEAARHLLQANSFADIEVFRDYSGLPRIAWGKTRQS